jgi:hypothetical protein
MQKLISVCWSEIGNKDNEEKLRENKSTVLWIIFSVEWKAST